MPSYFSLTSAKTVTAQGYTTASLESAVDAGRYRRLLAAFNRLAAAEMGTYVVLQTAAVKQESAFFDIGIPIDLSTTGMIEQEYPDILRWVRWRVYKSNSSTPYAVFAIDIIAREE